jgi:hypothetical protein
VHRKDGVVTSGGDGTARMLKEHGAHDRHRLARERPLPPDEHRQRAAKGEKKQPRPEELLGDDLMIRRKDVFAKERRRLGVNVLKIHRSIPRLPFPAPVGLVVLGIVAT